MIDWITEEDIDFMMSWYGEKCVFWPSLRFILELLAISYSTDTHNHFVALLNSLSHTIPCQECADHFKQQLFEVDIPTTRIEMLKLVIDMHNNVNRWNWKKELTFREALKSISERIESKKNNN